MRERQNLLKSPVIIPMLFFIIVVPLFPLLISWRWNWWEAWVYAATCILGFAISRALAARRHPDLLEERARFLQHEDAKPWDKVLAPMVGLGSGLVPLVAGLDGRWGWSAPIAAWVELVALAILIGGYALGSYALIENRFFSGMVRIQTDRDQRVVSGGPYAWVRHPGYAGALWSYLATPFLLGSWWALAPTALLCVILVLRTALEDRALHEDLAGYRDYAARVRYRLFPGVW